MATDLQEHVRACDSKIVKYKEEQKKVTSAQMSQLAATSRLPVITNPGMMAPQNQMMYSPGHGPFVSFYPHYPSC